MSDTTYAIVFNGEILEDFQVISVKAHMAKLLKADADKMAKLFSGKQIVLKRTADKAEAQKYGIALKKVGADVKIKVIKADAAAANAPSRQQAAPQPAAPQPAAPQPATPTSEATTLTLVENVGNIFDPAPTTGAVADIDTSAISLAEDDDAPLVEPVEQPRLELDLSSLSVSENDGAPLVEPSNEDVPVIEAPDFGLDEPGAVLETLKEEKELLSPNTMGMTLAMAGSDLLEPDEKPPAPPPKTPDTSSIALVPNFDAG